MWQQARKDGWRSRAVYKLEQIDQKERLLKPDMTCIDLGAAPGSWSQYVTEKLKGQGTIVAIDLLPMDSLPSVEFIQGDFTEDAALAAYATRMGDQRVDLVMSDMAPNISGIGRSISRDRCTWLNSRWICARTVLRPAAISFVSFFRARASMLLSLRQAVFERVRVMKPKASRAGSREVYLVARNYQL